MKDKKTLIVCIYLSLLVGFFSYFSWRNKVYADQSFTIFPLSEQFEPRIYDNIKYGYRHDHSSVPKQKIVTKIIRNIPLNTAIEFNCVDTCISEIWQPYRKKSFRHFNGAINKVIIDNNKEYEFQHGQSMIAALAIIEGDSITLHLTNWIINIGRTMVPNDLRTLFPFYLGLNDEVYESELDSDFYSPKFEREYALGVREDGSSIYLDDEIPRYKVSGYKLNLTSPFHWHQLEVSPTEAYASNIPILFFNSLLAILFAASLTYLIFWRDRWLPGLKHLFKKSLFFKTLLFYSILLLVIFREGIGDYALDWEAMYVQYSKLEFYWLYSLAYQFIGYLFWATSLFARTIFCIILLAISLWALNESLRGKIHKIGRILLILLPALSPLALISVFHTQRFYFTAVLVMAAYLILANIHFSKQRIALKWYLGFSLLAIAFMCRVDFVFFFLPYAIFGFFNYKEELKLKKRAWLLIVFPAIFLLHQGQFFRGYKLVSYRKTVEVFREADLLTPEHLKVFDDPEIKPIFIPMVSYEKAERYKRTVRQLIWDHPLVFIHGQTKKVIQTFLHPPLYRGINIYNNQPFDKVSVIELSRHRMKMASNDLLKKYTHYHLVKTVHWLQNLKYINFLYLIALVPLFFPLRTPLMFSFALAFLIKLAILFVAAPMESSLYLADIGLWAHFVPGLFLAEWRHKKAP